MRIGFDAKRALFNRSGLGVYSRNTLRILGCYTPDTEQVLFSPKPGNPVGFNLPEEAEIVTPTGLWRAAPSLWRSSGMTADVRRSGVDIYHGLSHELPSGIRRTGVRSIVTMHDLIFVRHPELYKPMDRCLYTKKYLRSCHEADLIIAISEQTRRDLIEMWHLPDEKIEVVYQGCDPVFGGKASDATLVRVREKYNLPHRYILSVGSIEPRKNLMLTLRAMAEGGVDVDLVACGRHTPYADELMAYAASRGIADRVRMHHSVAFSDLPALYQMASVMVYTSFFEGFGIPILEAMNSRTPVITSAGGVFPETGGDAALYVDPDSVEGMIGALYRVLEDPVLREQMVEKGLLQAAKFAEPLIAENLMRVYRKLLR